MTRPTHLRRLTGGLGAATLATGLALAAPLAYAHDGGDDHGGHSGHDGHAPSHLDLPDGFQPEGIATGSRHTAYLGSLADGDILALDLRSGMSEVISQGPGTPSAGLKVDHHRLFVSGGSGGDARVIDARSGALLKSYTLVPAGTAGFVNDVVVTDDSAWFTDSFSPALYRIPLDDDRGHHGRHHALPDQSAVQTIALTGDWVQNAGFNANGIATTPDGDALLVMNSSNGLLYRVTEDGVARQVDLGGFVATAGDGILRKGHTLYVVQNQLDQVAVVRLSDDGSSGELRETLTSPDFDVPTAIARSGGDLFLPNARFNTPPTPTTDYWVTGIED